MGSIDDGRPTLQRRSHVFGIAEFHGDLSRYQPG
jgi:hypothetical protein